MYAIEDLSENPVDFIDAVKSGLPFKPLYVKLKLVWTCNLRCGMCNHWRDNRDKPLEVERFKQIVDELAEMGCRKIHVTGGEPMLYPDILELMSHIHAAGIRLNMTTNGTLITKENARAMVKAGLRTVNVSIDSPHRKTHDKVRGVEGAWKKTVKGIGYLKRYMKKGQIRVNTVVGRSNYESLADLPDFLHEIGVDQMNLIPLDEHTDDLKRLSKSQIKQFNAEIGPVLFEKGVEYRLISRRAQAFPFGEEAAAVNQARNGLYAQGYYQTKRCFAPWTHTLINHLGQVSICCMLRDKPIMGNLHNQSMPEVWDGEAYSLLRNKKQPLFNACHQCDDFIEENEAFARLVAHQESLA